MTQSSTGSPGTDLSIDDELPAATSSGAAATGTPAAAAASAPAAAAATAAGPAVAQATTTTTSSSTTTSTSSVSGVFGSLGSVVSSLASQLPAWAASEAQQIAAGGLTGIQISPQVVAQVQDLLQKLATVSLQTLGASADAKATLTAERDLYLSALEDLGVVGVKNVQDVVSNSVRKFFVDAADFVLQGVTKVAAL